MSKKAAASIKRGLVDALRHDPKIRRKVKTLTRNPQDITLRNARAAKRRTEALERRLASLENRVRALERHRMFGAPERY